MMYSIQARRGAAILYVCIGITIAMAAFLALLQLGISASSKLALNKPLRVDANLNETLNHLHKSLLAYTIAQGFSNSTEFGRLPCPDKNNDGTPDSPCNTFNSHIGMLPIRSKIATPTFYQGLSASSLSVNSYTTQSKLQYAVAPYVNNGEDVLWSDTVPANQLLNLLGDSGQLLHSNAVAVMGQSLRKGNASNELIVSGQYRAVSLKQWQAALFLKSRSAMATVTRQLMTQRQANLLSNTTINTPQLLLANGIYTPVSSGCNCSCTKTRCTCSCLTASQWQSNSSCNALSSGTCSGNSTSGYTCVANVNQICVFNGSSSLQSKWPATQYSPKLAQGSTCKPPNITTCPLSLNNTACVCKYDWPLALQGTRLQHLRIAINANKLAITDGQQAVQLSALMSTNQAARRRQVSPFMDQSLVSTVSKTP